MKTKRNKQQVYKKSNFNTRFQKGQSGNPAGRPKQTQSTEEIRKQILSGLPKLIEALFAKATDGDLIAAKLLLDRVLPPMKPQLAPVAIALPNSNIDVQVQNLFGAASQGHIPLESATELARIAQIVQMTKVAESIASNNAIDLPSHLEPQIDHSSDPANTDHITLTNEKLSDVQTSGVTITEMSPVDPQAKESAQTSSTAQDASS